MTGEAISAIEESVDTGESLLYSDRLGQQTALIEILTVAAAVLIVVALVFIIFQLKRKNRGRE